MCHNNGPNLETNHPILSHQRGSRVREKRHAEMGGTTRNRRRYFLRSGSHELKSRDGRLEIEQRQQQNGTHFCWRTNRIHLAITQTIHHACCIRCQGCDGGFDEVTLRAYSLSYIKTPAPWDSFHQAPCAMLKTLGSLRLNGFNV